MRTLALSIDWPCVVRYDTRYTQTLEPGEERGRKEKKEALERAAKEGTLSLGRVDVPLVSHKVVDNNCDSDEQCIQ